MGVRSGSISSSEQASEPETAALSVCKIRFNPSFCLLCVAIPLMVTDFVLPCNTVEIARLSELQEEGHVAHNQGELLLNEDPF